MAVISLFILSVCCCIAASPIFTPYFSLPHEINRLICTKSDISEALLSVLTNWSTWVSCARLALLLLITHKLFVLLFKPLHLVKSMVDTGYIQHSEKPVSREVWTAQVVRRRKRGDVPPVYPNGWFCVLHSCQLERGCAKSVTVLGMQLAVFRGEDGHVYALDAYCPHLGANLGCGGRVLGNCLECPFHGWSFRGNDGKCVRIPYADKVPEFAKTEAHTVVEMNGSVYVWYHAEGNEPNWMPEEVVEISDGRWRCAGMTEHMINSHIEEVPENIADIAHLNHLHGPVVFSGANLTTFQTWKWAFASHKWDASWAPCDAPEKHCSLLNLKATTTFLGLSIPFLNLDFQAKQIGPGIVQLPFVCPLGRGVLIQGLTPIEPMVQRINHQIYIENTIPTIVGKIMLWAESIQLERDVTVWNNKTYRSKPLLVKEDNLIAKHRRWFSQFYSEHSPRFTTERSSLDW